MGCQSPFGHHFRKLPQIWEWGLWGDLWRVQGHRVQLPMRPFSPGKLVSVVMITGDDYDPSLPWHCPRPPEMLPKLVSATFLGPHLSVSFFSSRASSALTPTDTQNLKILWSRIFDEAEENGRVIIIK